MTPRILTPSPCWPEPDIKASCLGTCLETVAGSKLLGCVSSLNELQRRVVTLRMLEELSGEEVARELNLRPDHVATLLYRAKKELLRCISAR